MNLKNNKKITYKHLERLLTCQDYFVWNNDIENKLKNFDTENNEETSLWEIFSDIEIEELENYNIVEIIKNGYSTVFKLFNDFILKKANKENKNVLIISEKSNELSFKKTMEAINDKKIDWIINPVFIYNDLISKPTLYKKNTNELFVLLHSSTTQLKNFIRAYFDYSIALKLNIIIKDYLFFLYDKEKEYTKSKDLSFIQTKYCRTSKSKNKLKKITLDELNEETIIKKLNSGIIKKQIKNNKSKDAIKKEEKILISLYLDDFDEYINKIQNAKNVSIWKEPTERDNTVWGTNPNFLDIFNFEKYYIDKYSGNILKKSELLEISQNKKTLSHFSKNKKSLHYILNNIFSIDINLIMPYIEKIENSNIAWYDFEGFYLPYIIIPHTKPYQQIIFQVSIIKTKNEEITYLENYIVDPKTIHNEDFKIIIDKIYSKDIDYYIVYNKEYELKRLSEMIDNISWNNSNEIIKNYEYKVNQIKEKTIDLLDLFRISNSKENIPPIFIPELLGFSSIKKIEKYITKNNLNLKVMIEPYNKLKVQNGLMAMNKAIQRYLLSINDNEWKKVSEDLKKYCENDVKAMIMVYFFVKDLIKNNF